MLVLATLSLTACAKHEAAPGLPDLPTIKANLAFTCTHEADHLPPLNPEADQLFQYARYLERQAGPFLRQKQQQDGTVPAPKDDEVARLYRIAAVYGHYKANDNLQQLLSHGFALSPDAAKESIDLATKLVDQGIPLGYYDIGYYLNLGYGLKQNKEMALRYFRKAADLGNPDAQYYVAEKLWKTKVNTPADGHLIVGIATRMYQCAAEQGHLDAAQFAGVILKSNRDYTQAIATLQKGISAGNSKSAGFLSKAFLPAQDANRPPADQLFYLNLSVDTERSRRYEQIWRFLDANQYSNPKVPDIDQIVPLPPAPLPAWDGTFQWQKDQQHVPPKPSEALIAQLAKDKNLDPTTGLPFPRTALGTRANTGERCPESGTWCMRYTDGQRAHERYTFQKGQTLPTYALFQPRRFIWLDDLLGHRHENVAVTWELLRHARDQTAA